MRQANGTLALQLLGSVVVVIGAVLPNQGASAAEGVQQACPPRTERCDKVLKVPTRSFPTIQSAVDAANDGDTVRIAAGVYTEPVRIAGKRVNLVGPDREDGTATIVGEDRTLGTLAFGEAGGGLIRNLSIEGGAYGVAAERDVLPASVTIQGTSISKTGRGVYGAFTELTVKDAQIYETTWSGMSVTGATSLLMLDVHIFLAQGCGLYLSEAFSAYLVEVNTGFNSWGGICIYDSDLVVIKDSTVVANRRIGIDIRSSSYVGVLDTFVSTTLPLGDGRWGDGISVWLSDHVSVTDSQVIYSERAGISNFGSDVALKNTEVSCCAWELEGEPYLGQDWSFQNLGGNTCGCPGASPPEPMGSCTAETVGIEAPEPIGA